MREQTRALLTKSAENLAACEDLIHQGHIEIAASRAYYAMFYAAEAALFEEGLEFSSHGATHAAFGEHLAKTKRVNPALHRYLLDAYRARQSADYDAPADISHEDANALLSRAREFYSTIKDLLGMAE